MAEKLIDGYDGIYKIDDKGNVYTKYKPKTGKIWSKWTKLKWVLDKHIGYYLVTLVHPITKKRTNKFIHRLLMESFIPNSDPKKYKHVNHIDGNKENNDLSNLEWVTPGENTRHAIKLGLSKPGEASKKAIKQIDLNTGNVIAEFESAREANRITGIAHQNISKVLRGLRKHAGGYFWEFK